MNDETFVNACLHGIAYECRVYLENLTFSSFAKFIEAAQEQTNQLEPHLSQ